MKKRLMAFVLIVVMALSMNITTLAAGNDTVSVAVIGEFEQTEARKMLSMMNDFRTGDDAWYWNQDNTTTTQLTDLQELTYDYDLEQIAMARALEIALSFSHTRPNGQDCYTLTTGGTRSYGENIAAGSGSTCNTAEKEFTAWREDDEDYDGQGHRRNMLQKRFNAVGIGHVVYNGCHYWVQEFGRNNSGAAATEAFDEPGILAVEVDPAKVTAMDVEAMDAIELEVGEFVEFPDTTAYILMEETWPQRYYCTVFAIPECTVDPDSDGEVELSADDEEIDIIKSVKGVKAGNVILDLTVTMGDKSKTVPLNITVKPIALENAVITLDKESYAYTGKEVIPEVTVELNGNILTSDDYEVEYRDNTGTEDEDSTGTVVITGKGNYTGTVQTTFQIVVCKHEHEENVVREATCTEAREKSLTCTKCGDTKTEVILATGHTEVIDAKVDPTCTEPGLTDGKKCSVCGETLVNQTSIAATGHSYGEWEVVKEATWDEDGEEKHVCSICNAEETRTINRGSYGHQDDFTVEGEVIKAPTCTEAGS